MTPFNPDSWGDVVVLVFLGVCSVAGVSLPAWLSHGKQNKQSKQIGDIKSQVINDHDTNLRDDIDAMAKAISEGFHELRRDIGGIREELRHERDERLEGDRLHLVRTKGGR